MKKLAYSYVKYVVKKPVLFGALIFISITIIIIMTLTTKINLIVSYDAIIDKDTIKIEKVIEPYANYLYVYSNRNEYVYRFEVRGIKYEKDSTTIFIVASNEVDGLEQQGIQVDIPMKEISLFERIFERGERQ